MSLFHSQIKKEEIEGIIKKRNSKIVALGVCGAGMSPLVRLLASLGCEIVGTDKNLSNPEVKNLAKLGIMVYNEKDVAISSENALIYSLAVSENNGIYQKALEMGIPAMSRAEALGAAVSLYKDSIAVSGSHGKSTLTAMLGLIFKEAKMAPTLLCGAGIDNGDGFDLGEGELIIYESCEYKDSFLYMPPRVQIVTSVELDHTDYFADIGALRRSFKKAIENAREAVVLNIDDPFLKDLAKRAKKPVITYGTDREADFTYELISMNESGSDFYIEGNRLHIDAIGEHNVMNALGAYSAARFRGVRAETVAKALAKFRGVKNRLERLGDFEARPLYIDYAHHPTEIRTAINTVKMLYGSCTVVFKPHTYSRTAALWDGFREALSKADNVILTDVYAAREVNTYGVSISALAEEIGGKCRYIADELIVKSALEATDGAIIIMGAGGMEKIIDKLR